MRSVLICFTLCGALDLAAQVARQYGELVQEAFALYEQKEFRASAERYTTAFEANGWKGAQGDRYNAACSWSLAGVPDSAFFQLQRIVQLMDYANLKHISTDPDLVSLYVDPRWTALIDQVRANKERLEANYDHPMVALLDSIHEEDQNYRQQLDEVEQQHGRDSKEMHALWSTIQEKDSTNLIAVTRILDERGWLGADVVGPKGNSTLFLVIQHADIGTQQKYLPMMRDAVKEGRADASSLALLEDRVALRTGRRQIYGSQIGRDPDSGMFYISPLDDAAHVDERRAAVGLGPLSEYVSIWGLTWDPAEYEKQLPELEKKLAGDH